MSAFLSGRLDNALAAFARAAESESHEIAAIGQFNRGVTLGALDRSEDEIAVYDELVERFGEDPAPALREPIAKALFNKGFRLGTLDRSEDEIAVYDELVERFGSDPALAEVVARGREAQQAHLRDAD